METRTHPMNTPPFFPRPRPNRTPLRLAIIGILIIITFLTLHALGWRAHTAWFSGTPTPGSDDAAMPLAYAGFYFLAWFIAPIYLIAAFLYHALFLHVKNPSNPLENTLEIQKSSDILPPSQTT